MSAPLPPTIVSSPLPPLTYTFVDKLDAFTESSPSPAKTSMRLTSSAAYETACPPTVAVIASMPPTVSRAKVIFSLASVPSTRSVPSVIAFDRPSPFDSAYENVTAPPPSASLSRTLR